MGSGRCRRPVGALSFDWSYLWSEISIRICVAVLGFLFSLIKPFNREVYGIDWYHHYYPFAETQRISEEVAAIILGVSIIVIPLIALCAFLWLKKMPKRIAVEEAVNFVMGISLALLIDFALTEIIKNTYARPRPDYLSRCFGNDKSLWPVQSVTAMPAVPQCTNSISVKLLRDGRKSFPSAHSSLAAATYLYCGLWIYRKLSQIKNTGSWRLAIPFSLVGVAAWIAVTRTSDYRHFPTDVLAGFLLGSLVSYIVWKFYDDIMKNTYQRYRSIHGIEPDDNCDIFSHSLPAMYLYVDSGPGELDPVLESSRAAQTGIYDKV